MYPRQPVQALTSGFSSWTYPIDLLLLEKMLSNPPLLANMLYRAHAWLVGVSFGSTSSVQEYFMPALLILGLQQRRAACEATQSRSEARQRRLATDAGGSRSERDTATAVVSSDGDSLEQATVTQRATRVVRVRAHAWVLLQVVAGLTNPSQSWLISDFVFACVHVDPIGSVSS